MAISLGIIDAQKVFFDGGEILGTAEVELPTIAVTNNEYQNSGIAGKLNIGSTGSLEPMEATFNFQQIATEIKWLYNPGKITTVEILSGMPTLNFQLPNISVSAQAILMTGQVYSFNLGSRRIGEINEPQMIMNVWAMTFLDNGIPVFEVDVLQRDFPITINGIPVGLATALKNFI